jgi:DNA processing protein
VNPSTTSLCLERGSPSWPAELNEIEGAPERVWVRGQRELLARRPRIAVVGTRAPSPYGEAQARRFALALAEAGVVVVSGLARGVDHAAHRAALDARGATIAVLGSGVDRPWPTGALTDAIGEHGLLLSEFHPGEAPRPHHFPLRNRVISGLSCGVLVVEAAHASGSLITARWAADQGRTVWALPGRVDQPMSRGTHRLIREGATLVESPDEILAEVLGARAGATSETPKAVTTSELGARVLAALRGETLSADELSRSLSEPPGPVLVALVELELSDLVARAPGGIYRRL